MEKNITTPLLDNESSFELSNLLNTSGNNSPFIDPISNSNGNHGSFCNCIECRPIGSDHQDFMADMPEEPEELMDDFQQMALWKQRRRCDGKALQRAEDVHEVFPPI